MARCTELNSASNISARIFPGGPWTVTPMRPSPSARETMCSFWRAPIWAGRTGIVRFNTHAAKRPKSTDDLTDDLAAPSPCPEPALGHLVSAAGTELDDSGRCARHTFRQRTDRLACRQQAAAGGHTLATGRCAAPVRWRFSL